MFYDAAQAGHASDTGFDCLSVATAASISPTGAAFTDNFERTSDLPVQPGRGHRPQPLHRPGQRDSLAGLEVQ